MKYKYLICLSLISILMFGCSVPLKLNKQYVNSLTEKSVYSKDEKTGLCYAFFAISDHANGAYSGLGVTEVSCEKVTHLL